MTPLFAQAVDPIFLTLLPFLDRLSDHGGDTSADLTVSEMRRRLDEHLRNADSLLRNDGDNWTENGKYAIVAWSDEMLRTHQWLGQSDWIEVALEQRTFNSLEANQDFYRRASEARNKGSADATEVYYICVMLGFVGLYRDPNSPESRSQIDRLGMPPNLGSWTDDYGQTVNQARGDGGQAVSGRPDRVIKPATPHWSSSSLVWPVVLSVVCAGLNVLAWWGGWL